jgi:hypothetical protein
MITTLDLFIVICNMDNTDAKYSMSRNLVFDFDSAFNVVSKGVMVEALGLVEKDFSRYGC